MDIPPSPLHGLNPEELIARAMQTARPSAGAAPWLPPEPEEVARLLPQYRVEKLLGHGGMGAVYKGWQAVIERPVAIKLLPAEVAADESFVSRFIREARTLAHLQHPGIVGVYDFGQTKEGHLYFVMEFVEGTDLQRVLRGPGVEPEQALALIGQICDALHYAHARGVVHRDIKPANVLLTTDGRAKVADFGLARAAETEEARLTQTLEVMGTPAYMAPEQHRGKADHRADIFALGVMLYEMLTGQLPRGAFMPPSQKVQVDVRIDQVVLKALQEMPERRYQQVGEMKTDVDRISTPAPAPAPSGFFRRRPPWVALALLAVALPVGIFLFRTSLQPLPPTLPAIVEPARTPLSTPLAGTANSPAAATKEQPFVNSLGMKFVPVPIVGGPTAGQRVLFSIWETRVEDYAAFVKDTGRNWHPPDFPQTPLDPAGNVGWADAVDFTDWLTARERAAQKIGAVQRYRLPSDYEWSCAVGIGKFEDAALTPAAKSNRALGYPWGFTWPPPPGAGNFADETAKAAKVRNDLNYVTGYNDGYARTAPVGSFGANEYGLYDLAGNVWEHVLDWYDEKHDARAARGGSFLDFDAGHALSSRRERGLPASDRTGFRCVLAGEWPGEPATSASASTAPAGERVKLLVDLDFSKGLNGFPEVHEEGWQLALVGAEYQMLCHFGGLGWTGQPQLQQLHLNGDFDCEVRARILSTEPEGGWGIGLMDPRGIVTGVFLKRSGQIGTHHFPKDSPPDWTGSAALRPGPEVNVLRIEARGPRLRVYANGQFAFDRDHPRPQPDTALSIFSFGDAPPQDVRLQSIKVWSGGGSPP